MVIFCCDVGVSYCEDIRLHISLEKKCCFLSFKVNLGEKVLVLKNRKSYLCKYLRLLLVKCNEINKV